MIVGPEWYLLFRIMRWVMTILFTLSFTKDGGIVHQEFIKLVNEISDLEVWR
jgi:hypothetical protein